MPLFFQIHMAMIGAGSILFTGVKFLSAWLDIIFKVCSIETMDSGFSRRRIVKIIRFLPCLHVNIGLLSFIPPDEMSTNPPWKLMGVHSFRFISLIWSFPDCVFIHTYTSASFTGKCAIDSSKGPYVNLPHSKNRVFPTIWTSPSNPLISLFFHRTCSLKGVFSE